MTRLFCADCGRFRTWNCEAVWSLGLTYKDKKNGNIYWTMNLTDRWAYNCGSYEEVENPAYRLNYEEELRNESLKYGRKIIWKTSSD